MAALIVADGTRVERPERLQAILRLLGVEVAHWPLPDAQSIGHLLRPPQLSPAAQEALLASLDGHFERARDAYGYQSRDLVVLDLGLEGTEQALSRFARAHTHADDEARYILDGRGYFVFYDQADRDLLLEVEPGDFVRVPAGAEHAFVLGDSPRLKAVRYFTDPGGWVPLYTARHGSDVHPSTTGEAS
jgi:1,2-dihydroxy-3-keto-5-methylthiopentene dioxygenase